ncbi:BamA/TamA family outer membrane protein [Agarivorans sp. MS3-6]
MHKLTIFSALLVPLLTTLPSIASFKDPVDERFDLGHHLAENAHGFLPIPILITEPAVGYGGGAMGLFLHETETEKNKRKELAMNSLDGGAQLMPAAITLVGAAGTENGTWFAFAGHRHSWLNDSIRYTGGAGLGKANLDIYKDISIGSLFNQTLKFGTKTSGVFAMQQLQFRVADTPLMLGVKQIFGKSSVESDNAIIDKLLKLALGEGSMTSGLGLIAEYDTRNNLFFPTKGYTVNAEYMVYDEAIGSKWNYQNLAVDGQVFIPLANSWTLAFAGNYQYFHSNESFLSPTVRPYVDLRGVSSYRYQGDEVFTIQSQVMYAIDHRWTVSAFYGQGRTSDQDESKQKHKVDAYGAGFRYQIARRYGLYIGVDTAFSKEESAVYFNVGSGF